MMKFRDLVLQLSILTLAISILSACSVNSDTTMVINPTPTTMIGAIYYDPELVAQVPLTGRNVCKSSPDVLPTPTSSMTIIGSSSPSQDTLGIPLSPIDTGIRAQADSTAFIQELSEALAPYNHITSKNIIIVQDTKGDMLEVLAGNGLVSMTSENPFELRYIYRAQDEGCMHISIVVTWKESTNSTNNALQEEIRRLNNEHNWTNISMAEDRNLKFDAFYPFGSNLDVAKLANYLEWYDNAIFRLVLMRLPLSDE